MPAKNKPTTDPNNQGITSDNKPVKRKPGRPKGSKNAVVRKDHDLQAAEPGKNTVTTRFGMALNKLPKIDINNPEQVRNRIQEYYSICSDFDLKPTIAMLAFSFGVTRATLFNWMNGKRETLNNPECVDAIKQAYSLIGGLYETYISDGSMIPVSGFFLMKNNYGYKDTTDYVISANNDTPPVLSDVTTRANLLD